MEMKDHGLLVEKYRPSKLENFVGNNEIKSHIQKFIEQQDLINMVLTGPAGCGKTTLAKLITKNIECDYLFINASDENGIDTIREKVTQFVSTMGFGNVKKIVILDESDFLTFNAQASLRHLIEKFSNTARFILTCNYIEKIIDPLKSRCKVYEVLPPSKQDVAKHVEWVLGQEGIFYNDIDIITLINSFFPDIRQILNNIQASTVHNIHDGEMETKRLQLSKEDMVSSSYQTSVLNALNQKKPNLNTIRQIIADSNIKDYTGLYRRLYDEANNYCPGKLGTISVIINEHLYQSNFVVDKEINVISCISKILEQKQNNLITG